MTDQLKYTILILVLIIIPFFVLLSHFMELTASPTFCGSCHIMDSRYEDWFHTGSHTRIKCVDCHLPNNNIISHLFRKGIDGSAEAFYFFTGLYSEPLHASEHAKSVLHDNCVRCHGDMVSNINTDAMNCWDCHRSLYHNRIQ